MYLLYNLIINTYKWKVQVRQKYYIILHNFSKNFTDYTGIFDKQKKFLWIKKARISYH